MARAKAGFEMVRGIGRGLPGVQESTCYGQPALKTGGKMFTCVPSHRSAEAGSLAVVVDLGRREELLAEAPETYYVTEHYAGHPIVLVRLNRIGADALRGLLVGAMEFVRRTGRKGERRR
ncbi:MAG: MmcQ/YjbR family DNA-binding protein [Acidobacteria bacterium]|nr:MmcQ/YjbR family DNA-binding protein [Acidobacteriota bacterium]